MKKLILLLCVCTFFSCKKDAAENITKYNWVLTSAVVSPAISYNGKAETNFLVIAGSPCLNYNYTLNFEESGTFTLSSNGPLCDMAANSPSQKWSKNGDKVTLAFPNVTGNVEATLEANKLYYITSYTNSGVNYAVMYTYTPKSK